MSINAKFRSDNREEDFKNLEKSEVFCLFGTKKYLEDYNLRREGLYDHVQYAVALHKPCLLLMDDANEYSVKKKLRKIAKQFPKWSELPISESKLKNKDFLEKINIACELLCKDG